MTTIINAREEEQQKAANLIALKTLEQEGDARRRRRAPKSRA